MSRYQLVLFVHIASAMVLVGGSILVTPSVRRRLRKATDVREVRRWLDAARPLRVINPVTSIALLASGAYLASVGHWWRVGWVRAAAALWVVNVILAATVLNGRMGEIARLSAATSGPSIGADLDAARRSRVLGVTEDFMLASDLGVLLIMVAKPVDVAGSVALLGLVMAVVACARGLESVVSRPGGRAASPIGVNSVFAVDSTSAGGGS